MPRCELCGKTIALKGYRVGASEITDPSTSTFSRILAQRSLSHETVEPVCQICKNKVLAFVEGLKE
jgi:hypothetical protein